MINLFIFHEKYFSKLVALLLSLVINYSHPGIISENEEKIISQHESTCEGENNSCDLALLMSEMILIEAADSKSTKYITLGDGDIEIRTAFSDKNTLNLIGFTKHDYQYYLSIGDGVLQKVIREKGLEGYPIEFGLREDATNTVIKHLVLQKFQDLLEKNVVIRFILISQKSLDPIVNLYITKDDIPSVKK